jgi:hypothetical protein
MSLSIRLRSSVKAAVDTAIATSPAMKLKIHRQNET